MRTILSRRLAAVILWIFSLLPVAAAPAHAHALYAEETWRDGVALVQFSYSSGEMPTYAKVEVYSPTDDRVEFQNGRTDAKGRFAFLPDVPGRWRIIMADNMGHRVELPVMVGADMRAAAPAAAGPGAFSMPLRALLGVSLLVNAALTAALLRRNRRKRGR